MARQQTKQTKADSGMGATSPGAEADAKPDDSIDDGSFRQGETIVRCPSHGVRCESKQSGGGHVRYYCPTEGCDFSRKVEKQAVVMCPYHAIRCEMSITADPHFIVHSCPDEGCSYTLRVPRHDLSRRMDRDVRQQADYSARP